jgi:hypothetical protein
MRDVSIAVPSGILPVSNDGPGVMRGHMIEN